MPDPLQGRFDATLEQKDADHFGVAAAVLQQIIDAAEAAEAAQSDATQALSDAAAAQSTANGKASIAGQLGGSAASPDVRGLRETAGPTLLTLGAIADGQLFSRSGNSIVGVAPPSGVTDHGALAGLADDDHAQYSRADGTRAFTNPVSGVTPNDAAHLATKGYADAHANNTGNPHATSVSNLGVGSLDDGDLVRRSGSSLAGISASALRSLMRPSPVWPPLHLSNPGDTVSMTSRRIYAHYLGLVPAGRTIRAVRFKQTTAASTTGQAEVALATSAGPPNGTPPTLTPVAASLTESLTVGNVPGKNASDLDYTPSSDVHLWALWRAEFDSSQGAYERVASNSDCGMYTCAFLNNQNDLTTLIGTPLSMASFTGNINMIYLVVTEFF